MIIVLFETGSSLFLDYWNTFVHDKRWIFFCKWFNDVLVDESNLDNSTSMSRSVCKNQNKLKFCLKYTVNLFLYSVKSRKCHIHNTEKPINRAIQTIVVHWIHQLKWVQAYSYEFRQCLSTRQTLILNLCGENTANKKKKKSFRM